MRASQVVVVGDPDQAIYAFRGADAQSFYRLHNAFNCTELPLTVSYRCCAAVVEYVINEGLSKHLQAAPKAPDGEVAESARPLWSEMVPGEDTILCRNNAPLFKLALRLLAKKYPVQILGKRDILLRLKSLLTRFHEAATCEALVTEMGKYVEREAYRLAALDEDLRAEELRDQYAYIQAIAEDLPVYSKPDALIGKLKNLLSKRGKDRGLTLSTVHQAKGKEWERVWILRPELMPPKWLKEKWARALDKQKKSQDDSDLAAIKTAMEQERHVEYVAYTRAKMGLFLMNWDEREPIDDEDPDELGRHGAARFVKLDAERNRNVHAEVRQANQFGNCGACSEPAGLITPGGKRFCGPCGRERNWR